MYNFKSKYRNYNLKGTKVKEIIFFKLYKMQVAVYIIPETSNPINIERVKLLFENSLFDVNVIERAPPANLESNDRLNRLEKMEIHQYFEVLSDSLEKYPNRSVICIKDTSITNSSAENIADIVIGAITSGDWDICYLCKWLDRCDMYTQRKRIHGKSTIIAKTYSPYGTQCIMFSPKGRELFLGLQTLNTGRRFPPLKDSLEVALHQAIISNELNAICVIPNLFNYDITLNSADHIDWNKTSECQNPPSLIKKNVKSIYETPEQYNKNIYLIILVILIFVISVVLLWCMYQVTNTTPLTNLLKI